MHIIWPLIVIGTIAAFAWIVAWSLCRMAAIGDRADQRRVHGERIAMEMDRVYWRRRHPDRYWPGR